MALLLPTPERCRWCEPPAFDEWLATPVAPAARRISGRVSHAFSFVVIPAVMASALVVPPLTTPEAAEHAYQNLALASEVVMVDLALTLASKKWIARRRPAFYYGRIAYTEYSGRLPSASEASASEASASEASASNSTKVVPASRRIRRWFGFRARFELVKRGLLVHIRGR